MPQRVLYQFTLSPYCVKVRRILEYKRLAYRTVEVNPVARGNVIRISGQKRVPVLVEEPQEVPANEARAGRSLANAERAGRSSANATVVADSTAIAEYLDSRYPEPAIYPADPCDRARVAMMEEWSDEKLAGDLIPFKVFTPGNARRIVEQSKVFYPARWHSEPLRLLGPPVLRALVARRVRRRRLDDLRADYERDLDLLDALASRGTFLAGERPTVVDFAVWGLLRTMEGLSGEELMRQRRSLASWYDRMKDV